MSTVIEETVSGNTETVIEVSVTEAEQGDSTPSEVSGNAFPERTAEEKAQDDEIAEGEKRFVALAEKTLDPKDMLKNYSTLGGEALKRARKAKDIMKAGSWNGKEDLASLCRHLETLVKRRVAVKTVEIDKYIRIHLFVEAVKPLVPNVVKLSYYQVHNKFLPTLAFDPDTLTGEIRKEWIGWVTSTVERQLSDEPMPIKELDESIAAQKKAIEDSRKKKKDNRTPEEIIVAEQRAAEATKRKERKDAQSKIADSIDKAIVANHANETDLVGIVESVMKDHGMKLPQVGFNRENITTADCKMIADAMFATHKVTEMKYLRDRLDALIKIVENASVTAKTG